MNFSDYDFSLPQSRIAKRPRYPRASAYLLNCLRGEASSSIASPSIASSSVASMGVPFPSLRISELPSLLRAGDIIVLNDTKVLAVRLRALYRANDSSKQLTVTLAERIDDVRWHALVRGAGKLRCGASLDFIDSSERVVFCAAIESRDASGLLVLRFAERLAGERLYDALEGNVEAAAGGGTTIGSMPLPPYIKRAADERDLHDYQTLFARKRGAVAAPTAGRHITPSLLATLRTMGVESAFVTLHVGIGSFKLLRVPDIESHRMASERVEVSACVFGQIARCRARGGRVLAVGTTVVRALESAALQNGYGDGSYGDVSSGDNSSDSYNGSTSLYITPGFRFRVVDLLLTNFHQARATPLILTCAFAGIDCVATAYDQARADSRYRFFSYGDACLFARGHRTRV